MKPLRTVLPLTLALVMVLGEIRPARAEGEWEATPESQRALERGLAWLAGNQGPQGNWECNDLGLVSMGALAFLSAGHLPAEGKYGRHVDRALDYVMTSARPTGLLNIAGDQRDMYNHGLSTFVLGQAYGMSPDQRVGRALERALRLIVATQCGDGGWDYRAKAQQQGHDLSLAVMQAKALRSAVDSGFEIPPEAIDLAIKSVREYYLPQNLPWNAPESEQQKVPGQFSYTRGGGPTIAMAAAGVVCLQEFAQYDDWRIAKNLEVIGRAIGELKPGQRHDHFDAYALYYVAQALYQVGGGAWQQSYPKLRDWVVSRQLREANSPRDGVWTFGGHVGGRQDEVYSTATACFILAIPNRYLPILQEGKIDSLKTLKPK